MVSAPIKITATVAAWLMPHRDPTKTLEKTPVELVSDLMFWGAASREKFSDYIRVGEADITLRLIPRDEQVRLAVDALKTELDAARAEWLTRQQAILSRINSLQALELAPVAALGEQSEGGALWRASCS